MPLYTRKTGGKRFNPELKIDLIDVLHRVETDRRKIIAYTPILKRNEVKREFGIRVVEEIRKQTLSGKDKNGNDFAKYSRSYRKSDIFKIYKGSKIKPDLKLTGDMQTSMSVIDTTSTGVIISFIDSEDGSKARGHIMGDNPNKMPIRDFFGLPDDQIEKIMKETLKDYSTGVLQVQLPLMDALFSEPIIGTTGDQSAFLSDFLLGATGG